MCIRDRKYPEIMQKSTDGDMSMPAGSDTSTPPDDGSMQTVSYTHLVHRGFSFSVSFPLLYAYFGRKTNYLWKDTTIYGGSALPPVSYTHLDVYKRQV